VKAFLEF